MVYETLPTSSFLALKLKYQSLDSFKHRRCVYTKTY